MAVGRGDLEAAFHEQFVFFYYFAQTSISPYINIMSYQAVKITAVILGGVLIGLTLPIIVFLKGRQSKCTVSNADRLVTGRMSKVVGPYKGVPAGPTH